MTTHTIPFDGFGRITEEDEENHVCSRHCRACNRRRQSEYRQSRKDT